MDCSSQSFVEIQSIQFQVTSTKSLPAFCKTVMQNVASVQRRKYDHKHQPKLPLISSAEPKILDLTG